MIRKHIFFDALLYVCNVLVAPLPSARLRMAFYRHVMGIEIGEGSHILSGLWLDCRRNCRIGRHSVVNQRCRLDNRGGIEIGDNVSISAGVQILTADHDLASADFAGRERGVTIGDYVFIGTGALILPGVKLGRGAAVGAGGVVTDDVEPFVIVAGVPARPIGRRPEMLGYQIHGHRHFF